MDLTATTVLFDFDGTISQRDIGRLLLEERGDPEWLEIEAMYDAGELGSREAIAAQFDCLAARDEAALRAIARAVPLDPGFGPLVEALRAAGAELLVVSDGFGFYVEEHIEPFGVPVLTNVVDWARRELTFPNVDRCCACSSCGTCKQAPIRDAQARGRTVVFVGDGTSDRKAALLADVLFAKDALAAWCAAFEVPHRPYLTLADVHAALFSFER